MVSQCTMLGHMYIIDAVDARILLARDNDPDSSLIEIANLLGLSRNTVHARLKRLRERGAIGKASSTLAPANVGRPLLAFVTLSVSQRSIPSVYETIMAIPEVAEAHTTTGNADLMLKVVAKDTVDLHRVTQQIQSAPGVQRSSTAIATTEVIPHRMSALLEELSELES